MSVSPLNLKQSPKWLSGREKCTDSSKQMPAWSRLLSYHHIPPHSLVPTPILIFSLNWSPPHNPRLCCSYNFIYKRKNSWDILNVLCCAVSGSYCNCQGETRGPFSVVFPHLAAWISSKAAYSWDGLISQLALMRTLSLFRYFTQSASLLTKLYYYITLLH